MITDSFSIVTDINFAHVLVFIQRGCLRQSTGNQSRRISRSTFFHLDMHRPKLNLSWGINESDNNSVGNSYERDIVPSTIVPGNNHEGDLNNNIKVLTETSDDEQEELMKLIKNQNERKREQEIIEHHAKMKNRSQSIVGK